MFSYWNDPNGGNFSEAGNWTPSGVPGSTTDNRIDLAGTYTIDVTGNAVARTLELGDPGAILSIDNGGTLTVQQGLTSTAGASVLVNTGGILRGRLAAGSYNIVLNGGTLDNSGQILNLDSTSVYGDGTIHGGTVISGPYGSLSPASQTLDNVHFEGVLGLGSVETEYTFTGHFTLTGIGSSRGVISDPGGGSFVKFDTADFDNADLTIGSYGTLATFNGGLTFGRNFVVYEYGPTSINAGVPVGLNALGYVINLGTINAMDALGGAPDFLIDNLMNYGTIDVSNGSSMSVSLTNLIGSILDHGIYIVSGTPFVGSTLEIAGDITYLQADVTESDNNASAIISSDSGKTMDTTLTTIGSSGILRILGGRDFAASNALAVNGQLQLGGGSFTEAVLTVGLYGRIFGFGTIDDAVVNHGKIEASGGTLAITGAVTTHGMLIVDPGALLEIGTTATGEVLFSGAGGTLQIDHPGAYAAQGRIDFTAGNFIDLKNEPSAVSTAAIVGGNALDVTLADGVVQKFQLVGGAFVDQLLTVTPDGATGNPGYLIGYGGSTPSALLAQTIAGFGTISPGTSSSGSGQDPLPDHLLASSHV